MKKSTSSDAIQEAGDKTGLAIFGGNPTFAEALHVGRPNIGDKKRLLDRISDMIDRAWLTNSGPSSRSSRKSLPTNLG